MNDNRNHIGPNWNGRAPRSMREAFPAGSNRIANLSPSQGVVGSRKGLRLAYRLLVQAILIAAFTLILLPKGFFHDWL